MQIAIATFTDKGDAHALRLAAALRAAGDDARVSRCGASLRVSDWAAEQFRSANALVFVGAAGIAARAVAPFLAGKAKDPAVVVVDDNARFAVSLLSGHLGGANDLAKRIAGILGATPVVTTATDGAGVFAVDDWARRAGLIITNPERIQAVSSKLLSGTPVLLRSAFPVDGALPPGVFPADEDDAPDIVIALARPRKAEQPAALHLAPRIAALGVGCRRGTPQEAVEEAFQKFCDATGIPPEAFALAASIDRKKDEPGLLAFCKAHALPFATFPAETLAALPPPEDGEHFTASPFVAAATGVDNVCERAAVAVSEAGALVARKMIFPGVTLAAAAQNNFKLHFANSLQSASLQTNTHFENPAAAREPVVGRLRALKKEKKIAVVGIGPGDEGGMTGRAIAAMAEADVLCGYDGYIALVRPLFPEKPVIATGMTREVERCTAALRAASEGKSVAVVCSGDAGVYGMAGLVYELSAAFPPLDIEVVPGVSAAMSGAAMLGAPLMHDFAVVSLSDLLTPWETIARRLRAAAAADFVLCLYNPASRRRAGHLARACDILLEIRPPDAVCGWARNIGRDGGSCGILTLAELRNREADMFTTVFVGAASTFALNGKMITPRGYAAQTAPTPGGQAQ